METCFVMQPFDEGDVYDKRFETVFAPGIKDAGLEPYRVDRDPGVSVPIDDIESGIRNAIICFAEITTDNPNVWFELGYSIAVAKEVVLVCSEERTSKFPFDVQHRSIIKYRTGAPPDFDELRKKIKERIIGLLRKQEEISRVASSSPIKDTEGLSQHEIVALVALAENSFLGGGYVNAETIRSDMNKVGFTDIAVALAIKSLLSKDMASSEFVQDTEGYRYLGYIPSDLGEAWLLAHQDRLVLRTPPPDIPF